MHVFQLSPLLPTFQRRVAQDWHAVGKRFASGLRGLLFACCAVLLVACDTTPVDPTLGWSLEKLEEEAKSEANMGAWDRAAGHYEKLEARASGTLLAQHAQIQKAYSHYKMGDKALAIATLDRFMRLHPASPSIDYALYLKGLVNFNDNLGLLGNLAGQDLTERDQQASKESFETFKELVQRFPQSKYTEDAKLRMNYIVTALAAYEVHVARFYFTRGAYVAVVNRAQTVLTDYPGVQATEEALYLLARAYDALSLVKLRDDAIRVLETNYPKSKFIQKNQAQPDKPWWQVW
jgi:outer membrane protein assembly factor BamD